MPGQEVCVRSASAGRRGGVCGAERAACRLTRSRVCADAAERELCSGGAQELQDGGDPVARRQRATSDAGLCGVRGRSCGWRHR